MGNERTKLLSEWTFDCKKSCPKKDYLKSRQKYCLILFLPRVIPNSAFRIGAKPDKLQFAFQALDNLFKIVYNKRR